jgi:hypothetical protein
MPDDIKDQIDAMLNIVKGTGEPDPDPPIVDPPVEDPPVEDPPEDPPVEDPPVDPPEDPPPVDPPPVEDDELKKAKDEIETLRKKLEDKVVDPPPVVEPEPEPEPEPIEDVQFLDDNVDLDDLSRDPKALNALLNKVYQAGVNNTRSVRETTLRDIPGIVKNNITIQATLKKEVETFYTNNEDLKPFKKAVAAVYEELASDNPDWTVSETFTEVEKETRTRLGLEKKAGEPVTDPPAPKKKGPKFAGTKGPRKPGKKPATDSLLNEIDEMNKDQ